jgi:putative heme-binding domain-containing protein
MEHGQLTQEMVTPLLDTEDAALQKTALAILSGRGWTASVVKLLRQWLAQTAIPAERRESLRATILTLCKDADLQELVAQTAQQSETAPATQLLLLEAVAQSPLDRLPASWVRAVGHSLSSADSRLAHQAVTIVRVHGLADFDEALRRLAENSQKPADLRVAAAAAVAPRLPKVEQPLFEFLKARLDAALPPLTRLAAATALGNARLNDEQLLALTKVVAEMGSLELPRLLAAFERSHNARVGEKLVEALGRSPGLSTLTGEVLRQTVRDYPDAVRQKIHPLLKRLDMDAEKMRARLDELEPVLSGGNVQRGRQVFFGTIAVCSACHAVKGEGGQIGPDLSKIAVLRGKRDLLESVLFPSAGFARGYEPYTVTTRSGKVYSGILKRETADAIYLIATDRAEIRVPRAEIDAIDPARTSIMPQGLEVQLSRQELTDLFAFLQSLR